MKEKKLDLPKIHAALRSIYRLSEFKNMNAPEVLLETEKNILRRHLSKLSIEETIYAFFNFESYKETQITQGVFESKKIAEDVGRYIEKLN